MAGRRVYAFGEHQRGRENLRVVSGLRLSPQTSVTADLQLRSVGQSCRNESQTFETSSFLVSPLRSLFAGHSNSSEYRQRISRFVGSSGSFCTSVFQYDAANVSDALHDASRVLLQWIRIGSKEFRTLRFSHTDLHAFHIAHSTVKTHLFASRRSRRCSSNRYADVLVHRLLAAGIHADATFPDLLNKRVLQQICLNLNYRHRMAQYAARASVDLHTQVNLSDQPICSGTPSSSFSSSSKIFTPTKMVTCSP